MDWLDDFLVTLDADTARLDALEAEFARLEREIHAVAGGLAVIERYRAWQEKEGRAA